MEKAGKIECLELQPRFDLTVRRTLSKARKIGAYVADFKYFDMTTGAEIIEDVKGMKTALYRWKKKHCEAQYGIQITEVYSRRHTDTPSAKKAGKRGGKK